MKKIILTIFVCCLMILVLTGCGINLNKINSQAKSEDEIADEYMEQIIDTIKNEDTERLLNMFSKEALSQTNMDLLEKNATELFKQLDDEIINFDGELSTATNNHSNEHTHKIIGFYTLYGKHGEYHILFKLEDKNEENKDAVGLSMLLYVSDELFNSDDFYWNYAREPGIYIDL